MNAPGESAAFVYILSNPQKALYVGYSTHLQNRVNGHKRGVLEHRRGKVRRPYTATRKVDQLVYFETFASVEEARARERQLKRWKRFARLI